MATGMRVWLGVIGVVIGLGLYLPKAYAVPGDNDFWDQRLRLHGTWPSAPAQGTEYQEECDFFGPDVLTCFGEKKITDFAFSLNPEPQIKKIYQWSPPQRVRGIAASGTLFGFPLVAFGDQGAIWDRGGSDSPWSYPLVGSGTNQNLNFTITTEGKLWVFGDNGVILQNPGGAPPPAPLQQIGVSAAAPFSGIPQKHLYGAAYGNGTLVVVGADGTVITTADSGSTWSTPDSKVFYDLHAATFGDNTFVAVGNGGKIITSTDNGATWAIQGSGLTYGSLNGVVFGNGVFVASGSGGVLLSSPDGSNWTPRASGTALPLNRVTFDSLSGTFVVAGAGGAILTSEDGLTWTSLSPRLSSTMQGVAYAKNTFVAVGSSGTILTSPTGKEWTTRASGTTDNLSGIAYGNNTFVAVGGVGFPAAGTILTSPTGGTWTKRTSPAANVLADVAFGNGTFAAVGVGGTIVTSRYGAIWTARASGVSGKITGIAHGNGTFVAVSEAEGILTSPTGASWTKRPTGSTNYLYGVTFGNNLFVAVGVDSNWHGTILTSPNGITWSTQAPGTTSFLVGSAYGNNTYMVVGQSGTVLVSQDGATWASAGSETANWLYRAAYGSSTFVGVGYLGTIMQTNNLVDNITVINPNTDLSLLAGQKVAINWIYSGNTGPRVNVLLLKGGVVHSVIRSGAAIGSGGTGVYIWTIPATMPAGPDYLIKVVSSTSPGSNDLSNANFTIKAAPGTITVKEPNGGQSWAVGTSHAVTWGYTGNPGARVNILLYKDGVLSRTIATRVAKGSGGNGSYGWTVPAGLLAGPDYTIKVVSSTYPGIGDLSDATFSLP